MLHPSYSDLIKVVNSGAENGSEHPVVKSRYSIVIATAKRARQIIAGDEPMATLKHTNKPLSLAVEEMNQGVVTIVGEDDIPEDEIEELKTIQ